VIDGLFAYAFTTGMLATVNPCGFAMLPAYLSYFLGIDDAGPTPPRAPTRVVRAVAVSLAVSVGFLAVFTVIGLVVRAGVDVVIDWAKYLTIGLGAVLVVLGAALLCGWHLPLTTPRLDRGGRDRTVASMFVFGVSYAIASIGCTLPLFVTTVLGSFTRDGVASGVLMILAYGAGMALVLTALTVTLALARGGLLRWLRRAVPYVERLAGLFLVLAGGYLVYYWTYNLRFDATGSRTGGGVADTVERWSADAQEWLQDRGGWVLGVLLAGTVAVVGGLAVLRRRSAIR
jgi:cytochrome c-type biogenesis protein